MNKQKTEDVWTPGLNALRQIQPSTEKRARCELAVRRQPRTAGRWLVAGSALAVVAAGSVLMLPRTSAAQELALVARRLHGVNAFSMKTDQVFPDGSVKAKETNEMDGSTYRLWMGGKETTVCDGARTAWVNSDGYVTVEAVEGKGITAQEWLPRLDEVIQSGRVAKHDDTFNGATCHRFDITNASGVWSVFADSQNRLIGIRDAPDSDDSQKVTEFTYQNPGFLKSRLAWPSTYRVYDQNALRAHVQKVTKNRPWLVYTDDVAGTSRPVALLWDESGNVTAFFVGDGDWPATDATFAVNGRPTTLPAYDNAHHFESSDPQKLQVKALTLTVTGRIPSKATFEIRERVGKATYYDIPVIRTGNNASLLLPWQVTTTGSPHEGKSPG